MLLKDKSFFEIKKYFVKRKTTSCLFPEASQTEHKMTTDEIIGPHEHLGPKLLFSIDTSYITSFLCLIFQALIAILLILFRETFIHRLTKSILPKSSVLIGLGITVGAVAYNSFGETFINNQFGPDIFFNILLPPIILEATFKLCSREFLMQIDGVLLLSFVGTIVTVAGMGTLLYLTVTQSWFVAGAEVTFTDCLIFSSVIAPIDPAAVLMAFEHIGVNQSLVLLILGESLFTDSIAIVLFETISWSVHHDVSGITCLWAILSFFTIGFGGFFIGCLYGCFSAFVCKFTSKETKQLEPLILLGFVYLGFLNAEVLHWSGIMSIIGSGFMQKRYAFKNLFATSRIIVEQATEVTAVTAETIIFILFGIKVLSVENVNVPFTMAAILYIILLRFVVIWSFGFMMNRYRSMHKLSFKYLFVMGVGGLRGAVSYSVSNLVGGPHKKLFQSTTLIVILFSTLVLGGTVQFWSRLLHFVQEPKSPTFLEITTEKTIVHVVAGMAAIMGGGGSKLLCWIEVLDYYDQKYIQPILCVKSDDYVIHMGLKRRDQTVLDLYRHPRLHGILSYARNVVDGKKQLELPTILESDVVRRRRRMQRRTKLIQELIIREFAHAKYKKN